MTKPKTKKEIFVTVEEFEQWATQTNERLDKIIKSLEKTAGKIKRPATKKEKK